MNDDLIYQISALVIGCGFAYYKGYVIEKIQGKIVVYSSGCVSAAAIKYPHQSIADAVRCIDSLPGVG
jgi:hypothetical protein